MARLAERTNLFTESVIREMTRLIHLHQGDRGINLAQGFPDFPAPLELKEAACAAIQADINQYAITWGSVALRAGLAGKLKRFYGVDVDPEREITVCCGATETMISALMAICNPGDEVIVIKPFYENYWPDAVLSGATPRFVTLREPDWHLDLDELADTFNERTKAIIINTPNNPTGKVFTRAEMSAIAELCQRWDAFAITDEIYEHLVYEGEHIAMMTLPGMRERTITISGASKTYSVTGWRVGWAIAPPEATNALRKVHDFLTVGAPAPMQAAIAVAVNLPDSYYDEFLRGYRERRDYLIPELQRLGFACRPPAGAYYVMTDISGFGFPDDVSFARYLVTEIGVAVVPGSSFYGDDQHGRQRVRFSFPKQMSTLRRAVELLERVQARAAV